MKRPKEWHLIRDRCPYMKYLNSNMYAPEERYKCKKSKKPRPDYDSVRCIWTRCPRLPKEKQKRL